MSDGDKPTGANNKLTASSAGTGGDSTPQPDQVFNLTAHHVDEDLLKKLWIASFITHHPIGCCCGMFILMMLLGVLDSLVFELSTNDNRAFFVESDEYVTMMDAFTLASEDTIYSDEDTTADPQTESASIMTIQYMFKLRSYSKSIDTDNPSDTDYWILTPENLEKIVEYENQVIEDEEWQARYCLVTNTDTYECASPSVARDVAEHFNYSYSDITVDDIKRHVWYLYSQSNEYVSPAFNVEYSETNQTYIYRSFLNTGLPIADDDGTTYLNGTVFKTSEYDNIDDNYDEQEDIFNEWAEDLWIDITVDHNANKKDGDLRVVVLIYSVYIDYFNVILLEGFSFIFVAILFVLVWMTVHLQSIFLSALSIFQILLSFPFAYFIYYYIYQIAHYDNLSLLIVFVLLGVGADDVFVFTDAWHQSLHFVPQKDKDNLEQRMTFAYRRASKAMLVTQITTFFAFLATSFSLIMPISAFGIWAATIVACNYFLVITMYPALLLIHHRWVLPCEKKYCCCCCYKEKKKKSSAGFPDFAKDDNATVELGASKKTSPDNENNNGNDEDDDAPPPLPERAKSVEEQADDYRKLEKFFGVTFAHNVSRFRVYILVFFVILFGLGLWQATGIEAQDEDESWFNDDHYMQKATDLASEFSASEEDGLVSINLLWGIDGVDRDGTDFYDPSDYGTVIYDDDFDMSSPEAQEFLYEICYNISVSDLTFAKSSVINPMELILNYTISLNETFPWTYIDQNDASYDADTQQDEFAYFMYNFSQSEYARDLLTYSLLYVQSPSETGSIPKVKYIGLFAYTSLSWDAAAQVSRDTRDVWTEWLEDTFSKNDDCPEGVCNPIQSSVRWAWLRSMEEFVRSAVQGILIAMPLAFVVLILSTRNWIVACFATLNIFGIMSCELAVMALQGWKFGISESIAIVIIIGFSVDYVVHLANAYLESTSPFRFERLSFALLTMGISVASGAVTTLLAGCMLTLPEIVFFQKMGVLIVTTIIFSIFWAMLFFIALLAQWGPENETGQIPFGKCFDAIKEKLCNKE